MDERILEFTIFCVEGLAERLKLNAKEVYKLLSIDTDILESYIIPCYEPLHTQSEEYIVNDLIEILKERRAIK